MVSLEGLAALTVLVGLIMYADFAGADFGGGIWTALASGPRAREQQLSLFDAIGPVWETNHVWLIYVVVALFTAFPLAFAVLFEALLVPIAIALIGIVLRGAAYAFRHYSQRDPDIMPVTGQVFSISSTLAPFFLGMAVTATAADRIRVVGGQAHAVNLFTWVTPFTAVGGLIGLAICAYLAPIYMAARTRGALQEDFRSRGMVAAVGLGALTALELPVALLDVPLFWQRLVHPLQLSLVAVTVILGVITLALLWKRAYLWAQISAAGTVAALMTGFAAALYPDFIIGQLTITQAAAPKATLTEFLITLAIGAAVLIPSLVFLYWTFGKEPTATRPPGAASGSSLRSG
jgi:cytochrome d ubiquinol oxidase subunit II